MKSRLAIVTVLVCGGLVTTPGVGLATPGLSGSNDASEAQYGPAPTPTAPAPTATTPTPTAPTPAAPAPAAPAPAAPAPSAPTPAGPVAGTQEEKAPTVLPQEETASRPTTAPAPTTTPKGGVKPDTDSSDVAPARKAAPKANVAPASETQPTRQVEAGVQAADDGELPFTGFAAIPILIGGVALLGTGAVLRRRTRDDA